MPHALAMVRSGEGLLIFKLFDRSHLIPMYKLAYPIFTMRNKPTERSFQGAAKHSSIRKTRTVIYYGQWLETTRNGRHNIN